MLERSGFGQLLSGLGKVLCELVNAFLTCKFNRFLAVDQLLCIYSDNSQKTYLITLIPVSLNNRTIFRTRQVHKQRRHRPFAHLTNKL